MDCARTKLLATLFAAAIAAGGCGSRAGDGHAALASNGAPPTPPLRGSPPPPRPVGADGVTVDATGGSFTFAAGRVELVIPANAVSAATKISVAEDTAMGGVLAGTVFKFSPDGLQFKPRSCSP
jgi:hypothetical protein